MKTSYLHTGIFFFFYRLFSLLAKDQSSKSQEIIIPFTVTFRLPAVFVFPAKKC